MSAVLPSVEASVRQNRELALQQSRRSMMDEDRVTDCQACQRENPSKVSGRLSITVVIFCWHICLISESMGHHDSEIMDDRSID